MMSKSARDRWISVVRWLLVVSYGLGAPYAAVLEYRSQVLSLRFDIPAELVYLTSALQLACAVALLVKPLASLAAGILTVTTVGAIVLHLRIGSPLTAWAAVLYSVVQVWFGLAHKRAELGSSTG